MRALSPVVELVVARLVRSLMIPEAEKSSTKLFLLALFCVVVDVQSSRN